MNWKRLGQYALASIFVAMWNYFGGFEFAVKVGIAIIIGELYYNQKK